MEVEPFALVAGKWFLIYSCIIGIFSALECIVSKRPKPIVSKRKVAVGLGAFCVTLVLFSWTRSDDAALHIQYVKSAAGKIINFDDCPADELACQNGGHCVDGDQSYTCKCLAGFTGAHCEINIDECESNPCQHGGRCQDAANAYTCSCTTSFIGDNCEQTIAQYEGCYIDKIESRDLPENLKLGRGAMTNAMCWDHCKGYKYAGTQFNNECWCGNSFSKHGKVDDGECNLLCDGNKEEICGGVLKNSVFYIGHKKI